MKIKKMIPAYLQYMKTLGRSHYTIRSAKYELRRFVRYLEEENVVDIEDLDQDILHDYQHEIAFSLTEKGKPLAARTQSKRLCDIKGFTRFLAEKDYLIDDPGKYIQLPKTPKRLPKVILSFAEIKRLMNACDMQTNKGYRDRIILEILYDTAVRRAEVAGIRLTDLDLEAGYLRIKGKGDKERVVPLSRRVCDLIRSYVVGVRSSYVREKDSGRLFLNYRGLPINVHAVYIMVKRYAKLAGIRKNISTHTFRHTCATHMLKNGAPVRHLQEMLGHESLESTQVYTRVTINDLKEIHAKYHPGENME